MKKIIFLIFSFVISLSSYAQWVAPIELQYLPQWSREYPVITNDFNRYFVDVIESPIQKNGKNAVPLLWTVLSINDILVSNMSMSDIHKLMASNETIKMVVCDSFHGKEVKCYNLVIKQKNNTHGYGDIKAIQNMYIEDAYQKPIFSKFKPSIIQPTRLPHEMRIIADDDLDFSKIKTYDILITGDDPLTDKKILEKFVKSGFFTQLTRDEENPDIIVCVAKNSEQSISSTYVPPTTQVINTGSTTRPVYNYITRSTSYVTTQHNKYQQSGGYTQTDRNLQLYLEFSILDAKKLNNPGQNTAPVIWKMTYNKTLLNPDFEPLDEYLAVADWNCFPFTYNPIVRVPTWFSGCVPTRENSYYRIDEVIPGSNADKAGLKKGDRIKYKGKYIRTEFDNNSGKYKDNKEKDEDFIQTIIKYVVCLAIKKQYAVQSVHNMYDLQMDGVRIEATQIEIQRPGIDKPFKLEKEKMNLLMPPPLEFGYKEELYLNDNNSYLIFCPPIYTR